MTTTTTLSFSQFIDLLLARLYDAQRTNPNGMIDLNALAADLRETVPDDWVVDAARVMQSRGLADCIISYGACRGRLTGEGMLFVEEGRGTGVISQYRQEPAQYFQHVNVSGSGNQVVVGSNQSGVQQSSGEQSRPQVFHLINEIEEQLKRDSSLGQSEREEFLNDVGSLRQQMKKRTPNLSAVAALLEPLGGIASAAAQVAMLIRMLNSR